MTHSITRLPVFRLRLTLRRIPRTSHQMYPGYTSGINTDQKVQDVYICYHTKKAHTFKAIHMTDMSLWNISCTKVITF